MTSQKHDFDHDSEVIESGTQARFSGPDAPNDEFCNDAELWGKDCPEFDALLEQPAVLMNGEMWGARDRRNTQDGAWVQTSMPWANWIIGQAAAKNSPAWGFSRHPVGKTKEGICIVLGSSIGKARKAKAMESMYAVGLDIDSGASLNKVLARIEELGLCALVYTSYNHNKRGLHLKRDDVLRKLGIKGDPSTDEVRQYLRDFDKNRYEENFIAQVEITDPKKQVKEGVVIELSTPPLEKYRLLFPLKEPVKIVDLAERHDDALACWEDAVTGLAVNMLDVHFDTSCTDPSRLFYTARHPADADDYYAAIVRGRPLSFGEIKPFKKSLYTSNRGKIDPFELAGGSTGGDKPPMAFTPSGKSLNEWHSRAKERFLLADVLETYCPDRIRNVGGEAQGHVHVECPFEHEHSKEGGTGTMAVNALDSKEGYWTWFCHHDACQGRHKLQYLEEALRCEWFPESVLFDDQFVLGAADGEEAPRDRTERHAAAAASTRDALLEMVAGFGPHTTGAQVRAVIQRALEVGADEPAMERLKEAIIAAEVIKASPYNTMLKEVGAAHRKKKRKTAPKNDGASGMNVQADVTDRRNYAIQRIADANAVTPVLFNFMDQYATVDAKEGRVQVANVYDFYPIMEDLTAWTKACGDDGETVEVETPRDVRDYIFNSARVRGTLPKIVGVKTTPFFDADGTLVETEGYHAGSKVYLCLRDLKVPGVSPTPTDEDVKTAKRLIVEEVLADFPLGGKTRKEIMAVLDGGEPIPALANTMAMILLPFVREMIDGPTPFHVLNKPAPGTGAGYLADITSIIGTGAATPPVTLPKRAEETGKTLTAVLMDGGQIIFFDNINHAVDSAELAAAATAPREGYKARILGRSTTVLTPIRQTWILTANTLTLSAELLRRSVLVELDRKVAMPGLFMPASGWRHEDVRAWAREHRGKLVWACLTLVQSWVAAGKKRDKASNLASFENWAGIMGGILKNVEIGGFLRNRDAMSNLADDAADDLTVLVQEIVDKMKNAGDRLYTGNTSKEDVNGGKFGLLDILNAMDEPLKLANWDFSERWDGDAISIKYTNARRAGTKFKLVAMKTYRVTIDGEEVDVGFKDGKDTNKKANYYTIVYPRAEA